MNMVEIVSIISNFLCLSSYLELFYYLLIVIPVKQLTGYSYWSTLLRFLLALFVILIVLFLSIFVISLVGSMIYAFFLK